MSKIEKVLILAIGLGAIYGIWLAVHTTTSAQSRCAEFNSAETCTYIFR